jgi:5-methylcytosine-specific restriction endonuclease McrA
MIERFPETEEEMNAAFLEVAATLAQPRKRSKDVMLQDYYSEYLRSPLWRRIKKRVLKRDGRICQSCGGTGTMVHHRSYERDVMEGKDDSMLATLCDGCHELIHFCEDGRKREPEEVDQLLLAGQRQTWIPAIHIDLRRRIPELPGSWRRLTATQRRLWLTAYQELGRAKWLKQNPGKPKRVRGGFWSPDCAGGVNPRKDGRDALADGPSDGDGQPHGPAPLTAALGSTGTRCRIHPDG